MTVTKEVAILGAAIDLGTTRRGVDMGPSAIRYAGLSERLETLGIKVVDCGDVLAEIPEVASVRDERAGYLPAILATCRQIATRVAEIAGQDQKPLVLGGDHSIAIGSLTGVAAHFRENGGHDIGLIWFDAHADINTPETSTSGNIHGMPLAAILGRGNEQLVNLEGFSPKVKLEYCAHVGARDLDAGERSLVHDLGLRDNFFTMSDIDKRGMLECVEDAIGIASKASGGYAVTFDVDMIDPRFAPGSGTLVRGGATYREAHLALEVIAEHGGMRSFEIVEVNPMLDQSNITVELACELILSVLGKTIL